MTTKTVSHPIKVYSVETWANKPGVLKLGALRNGIKDLLHQGRAVITAGYGQRFDVVNLSYQGIWTFETVYLGRTAVLRKGIRHQLRVAHREFDPFIIPHPVA